MREGIFFNEIHYSHPWIGIVFTQINNLGAGKPYFIITLTIFVWAFIAKNKKLVWMMICLVLSLILSGLICDLIKLIGGRARPQEFFWNHLYGFYFWQFGNNFSSFPSGHCTTIAAVATFIYLMLRRFGWICLSAVILVMLGRMICQAHYLSDVLAGAYLGFLTSFYLYPLYTKGILLLAKDQKQQLDESHWGR